MFSFKKRAVFSEVLTNRSSGATLRHVNGKAELMSWGFEVGRVYNRRSEIHAKFGGQQQGGIITPKDHAVIFIITGEAGAEHGYADRRRPDGVFEYFGEGQVGDMVMLRGNKAIHDHAENGRDLLLFTKTQKGLRFEGQYVFENFHVEPAPDREGKARKALVFELRPIEAVIEAVEADDSPPPTVSLDVLRQRAMEAAKTAPGKSTKTASVYERSRAVRNYVFARSTGVCEDCRNPAPFRTSSGVPFLEAHHIRRLTDGGPDDPRFMIALCPNCHRAAHHGSDKEARKQRMLAFVKLIEKS
jgi:5-methylcytosine-specific restriction protein A